MPDSPSPEVAPSTILAGRLVDATTNAPLPGLTLVASERTDGDGQILRRAVSNPDGTFELRLSDADIRRLMADSQTQPLFDTTVYLTVWNTEEGLGTLVARFATGPVPSRVELGDQPVTVPVVTRNYTLQALVVSKSAVPLAAIDVTLESVSIGQRAVLGTSTTDDDGFASFVYAGGPNASESDTDLRLQLTASHGGQELTRSPVLFSVSHEERIHLVSPEDPAQGSTELERLQAAIAGPVGSADLGALTVEEVQLLAKEADVYPPHLAILVRATALATGTQVEVDELYAMGRAGLSMTAAELLAAEVTVLQRALSDAFARTLVPIPVSGEVAAIDSIGSRMAQWAASLTIDPASTTARWSNLSYSGADAPTRQAFAAKWMTLTGSTADKWAQVQADPALTAVAADLEFSAGASMLVGEHGPAVEALVGARTAGTVTTLRDLSQWDEDQWVATLAGAGVPSALDGGDPTLATRQLATIAMRMVDVLYPSAGLARELRAQADPALVGTGTFLRDHEDFDIERTVIARYRASNPGVFSAGQAGDDEAALLAKVQRVHALTPGVDRPKVTQALLARGVESAGAVVHQGLDGFLAQHETALEDAHPFLSGSQLAKAVYAQALVRHGAAVTMLSQFGAGFQGTPMTVLPGWHLEVDPTDPATASLEQLFGSQDFCACEHCRSVYGPAAYLVDLLALLESRPAITQANALEVLGQRRADITGLELSCANTNTVMPYIDLVLELLEAWAVDPAVSLVARQTTWSADELRISPEHRNDQAYVGTGGTSSAVYPWVLPFDPSFERVRASCKQLGVPRLEAMHTLRLRSGDDVVPGMDRAAEALGMGPATLQIISGATAYTTASIPATAAADAWGMTGPSWVSTLSTDVGQVLDRSGLSFDGLREHLALDIIDPARAVALTFTEPSCDLDDAQIDGLDEATLDRLQRFVRLERATGQAPIELDRALRMLPGSFDATTLRHLADARALSRSLDRSVTSLLVLWAALDTRDYEASPSPYAARFLSRMVTPQLDSAFALAADGTDLAATPTLGEEHHPTIRAALSLSDAELQILIGQVLPASPSLSLGTLSTLTRHVVLARAMGLPIAELIILRGLVDVDPFASPADTAAFVREVERMHGAGLSTEVLEAITRHRIVEGSELDLGDEAIDQLLGTLWAALQTISDEVRPEDLPTLRGEALVQTMAAAQGLPADAITLLLVSILHQGGTVLRDVLLDPLFLADGQVQAAQRDGVRRLHVAGLVIRALGVDAADLEWYFRDQSGGPLLDLDALPLTDDGGDPLPHMAGLRRVVLGQRLRDELDNGTAAWSEAAGLEAPATLADAAAVLAEHSGWDAADLEHAMGSDILALSGPADLRAPEVLLALLEVVELVRRTGVRAASLTQWVRPRPTPAIADALQSALKARYDETTWPKVMTPIADRLRVARRDALVALIVGRGDFLDEATLYDHFLVDPLMDACMLTSRLKLATSAVQLFVQRVLMNLEQDDVVFPPATGERWSWMKTYRAWEANRKVFFYPENWIEPELRDDKTPFFEALEQHLQQGELTDEYVEAGYKAYLRKLHEVSHLEVPALFSESRDGHQIVHVLGRTRGIPPKYYYRTRTDDRVWSAWTEVPVDIPGDQVILAAHNRRIFVMWIEPQQETEAPAEEEDEKKAARSRFRVRVGWSELRDGQWTPKKLSGLSFHTTDWEHGGDPSGFVLTAYERNDGALFLDVLYHETNVFAMNDEAPSQCTMYRYDDCRDVFDELGDELGYLYEDLGLEPDSRLDGQRHHCWKDKLTLLHYDVQVGYRTLPVLSDLPHDHWLTTTKQERLFLGRHPAVFDDVHHAFYIVPSITWYESSTSSGVPYEVDPWSAVGGVTSPISPPSTSPAETAPALRGSVPWGGAVPGLASMQLRSAEVSSPDVTKGALLGLLGEGPMPTANAYAVAKATADIIQSSTFGNGMAAQPPVPAADGADMIEQWAYRFDPFHHPYTCRMLAALNRYGLAGVLASSTAPLRRQVGDVQVIIPDSELSDDDRPYQPYAASSVASPYPHDDFDFTPGGAYSVYNWELFVHAPLLIAERLRRAQRFEEAQRWYHFVFNPLQGIEPGESSGPQRFWNVKKFYQEASGGPVDVIKAVMSDEGLDADLPLVKSFFDSLLAWVADPFSPHAIARVRAGTYQKAIVRKYLDNLIDWADSLFRRDTIETINEATQLYLLAASILGPRPRRLPAVEVPPRTYDELKASFFLGGLTELEDFVPAANVSLPWNNTAQVSLGDGAAKDPMPVLEGTNGGPGGMQAKTPPTVWWAFCLPANEQLLAYWDRVADRLFKIRHCQNIDGVRRALRLFEPPIDPALLVRARAMGVDLGSAIAGLQAAPPRHRFAVLRGRAQELLGDVKALGGALLSALEKRDAEALGQIRATHELAILRATRDNREDQITEAQTQVAALRRQRSTVEARQEYYESREWMTGLEKEAMELGGKANRNQRIAQGLRTLAGFLHLIPNMDLGAIGLIPVIKAVFGGNNIGQAVQATAEVFTWRSMAAEQEAQLTSTLAGYQRRQDDWTFQAEQAGSELKQLDEQIVAAEIRVALAKRELTVHDQQVRHSEEIETFLRTKFTNDELYDWMIGRLSGLYFQAYTMAHDMARRAEAALRFELGRDDLSFIEPVYWDGLRKGLLAGERLGLDLRRMEVAQLDLDRRELELSKRISLRLLDPAALHDLRETGSCSFRVPEVVFDLDHPGHYFRRIKSASLSIPAVAGPQVSVSATLSLLSDETRIDTTALANGTDYPRDDSGGPDTRFKDGWVEIQSIATSRSRDDAGVFELSFRDEKYLPLEGAGAISEWSLDLPSVRQFDYRTISDVELELRYTARAEQGDFRSAASNAVTGAIEQVLAAGSEGGFVTVLSATKDFATGWERLLRPAEGQEGEPLSIPIVPGRFPHVASTRGIIVDEVRMVFVGDPSAVSGTRPMALDLSTPASPSPVSVGFEDIVADTETGVPLLFEGTAIFDGQAPNPTAVTIDSSTGPWTLTLPAGAITDPDALHDLWVLVRYHVASI